MSGAVLPPCLSHPTAQRGPHSAAWGAAPQGGDPGLCFPTGVAIKIPIVCVVLEGGPGTLDVRNCSCPLPAELRGAMVGGGSSLPTELLSSVGATVVPCYLKCSRVGVLRSSGVGLGLREGLLASGWG